MRRLTLLCVGVALLVTAWLAAYVAIAGMVTGGLGLSALLGIPVVLVLLVAGMGLVMGSVEEAESGPVLGALVVAVFVALVTMTVGVIVTDLAGPQIYHERFGEETSAVVTSVIHIRAEGYASDQYYVRDQDTGEPLGVLAQNPWDDTAEGDRIAVLVDPHGWMPPVPVSRMGDTTVAAVVLVCCFAAVVLAGLGIVGAAVVGWVRSGPVPPPGRRPR